MTKYLGRTIEVISGFFPGVKKILEIGARYEKGQEKIVNLRNLFKYEQYIGLDMRKGRGVDVVADATSLPFDNESFDLIICFETLEHAQKFWLIASEINRTLRKDGGVIISTHQNYPLHKHPSDYFRYTPYGLVSLFSFLKEKLVFSISPPFDNEVKINPQTVILVGWKKRNSLLKNKLRYALTKQKVSILERKPYRHRLQDGLKYIKRGLLEIFYRQEIEFYDDY